jgi:hypothetical protein
MPGEPVQFLYETVVYCGRLKEWRILNLLSGTVYSSHYNDREAAYAAIDDGAVRNGMTVKRVTLEEIRGSLRDTEQRGAT